MRVTDKMIFDAANLNSGRARDEAEIAAAQASTGVRVEHPWDDPGAAGLSVSHSLGADRFAAIGQSVQRAGDELVAADGALSQVNDVLARAHELAIQMSNSSYSAGDRQAASAEVSSLFDQSVALLNSRFGNRYLFGGNKDNAPPFDATGAYLGDTGVRQVEIAPGEIADASVRADQIIKGVNGGVDALGTLQALKQSLQNNDVAGVQNTLSALDDSISQVAVGRARLGGSMNTFDIAAQTARVASDADKTAGGRLTEVDVIEAASRLALAQRALDASLTASAQSFSLTLLDKLK